MGNIPKYLMTKKELAEYVKYCTSGSSEDSKALFLQQFKYRNDEANVNKNTRVERTCKIKPWRMEEDTGFYDCLECECGHVMDVSEWAKSSYCPHCDAEVVK